MLEAELQVGSLRRITGGFTSWPFAFEERPQACFEAIGDYRIERTGVMFSSSRASPMISIDLRSSETIPMPIAGASSLREAIAVRTDNQPIYLENSGRLASAACTAPGNEGIRDATSIGTIRYSYSAGD